VVPFVGLFTIGRKHDFVIELAIDFEIEVDGKVTKAYRLDESVKIKGHSATLGARKQSYQDLISEYRRVIYPKLTEKFLKRYL